MKRKFSSMGRVAIALVLALSLCLVMAVPVAASHTSSATVAFHAGASQLVGEASALDVVVTNDVGSLGKINEVKIDFSLTDFTSIGKGVEPTNWTGVVDGLVITYTAAAGAEMAADASLTFYPTVTNPETAGEATNPTVKTTDPGTKATLTTGTGGTDEISYVADAVGIAGNSITVAYVDPAGAGTLSVAVAASAITVTLEHDGTDPVSTADEVVDAINADADAKLLVDASTTDTGVVAAVAANLTGGSDADVDKDCPVTGILTIKEFAVTATPAAFSSGTVTDYTISFTTLTEIAATTGTITITFPADYDLALVVAADVSMTVAAGPYTTGVVTRVGQVVTIPAIAEIPAESAVVVTIAAHVKNPPTSGTYDIAVLTSGPDEGSGEVIIVPFSFGVVAGADDTVTAGTAFAVTISALNEDEGSDTGYAGSHFIDFTWTGIAGTIPTFELIPFTAGIGTSPENFILTDATETPTITAEENGLTGTSEAITINPAGVFSFTIEGEPASVTAGEDFDTADITVTAYDAEDNVKADYVGTVTWTSTDELAVLPADYTFTSEDLGVAVFLGSEFILKTSGDQTVTVTDGLVSATSGTIAVTAAEATGLELVADAAAIRANGSDPSTITASAVDDYGNVDLTYVAEITLATSLGLFTEPDPDENTYTSAATEGELDATLISSDVGTAIIKVTSGDFDPVTTTVKLLPLIDIDSIEVTVDKTDILNNGVDERTITATYLDGESNVVTAADGADYTVTFTTDDVADPPEVTLNPADGVVVPVAGVATVTLTTTLASPDTILVTATGTGETDDLDVPIDVNEGTFAITLYQGWNLISLPLIPTEPDIETVLAELIDAGTVIQVRVYNASDGTWSIWASTGPYALNPTLTEMDDGLGFWVEMSAGDALTATGCVLPAPPETPPTYSVYQGWNMIGFTSLSETTAAEAYLGPAVTLTLEAMYGYDAATGIYAVIQDTTPSLVPGQGYWLAVNAPGTIYP